MSTVKDFDSPTLSIIVTVYNVEAYIAQCIDSILCQDYTDYELIIIDDGSSDSGGAVCDGYSDGRVRVVHTENRGVSEARNAGLDICRGEYVLFADGDDVMIKGRLKKLMLAAVTGGAAVTVFHLDAFDNETGEPIDLGYGYNAQLLRCGTKAEIADELLSYEAVPWSPEVNIIRYDFIRKKKLRFDPGAIGVEDCKFFLDLLRSCSSFTYEPLALMRYRMNRRGSIMNTPNLLKLEARARVYEEWIKYADELESYGSGSAIKSRMGDAFFYNILQMYRKGIDKTFFDIVNNHIGIIAYAPGPKKKLFYRAARIFGAKTALCMTVRGRYKKKDNPPV